MTLPLLSFWKKSGAVTESFPEGKTPLHFSGFEQEYAAAKSGAALFDLSSRGKIRVSGPDRVLVLHRLLTNDLKSLAPGQGCYAAFLTAQGKIIADLHVYILQEEVLLDMEAGLEEKLRAALDRFIITEDVTLQAIGKETVHLSMWGPAVPEILKKVFGGNPEIMTDHQIQTAPSGVRILRKNHASCSSFEILTAADQAVETAMALLKQGALAAGETAYEALRIEEGIPRYGRDMDESVTLPETGLDRIAASETKGCYPGQEVVARTNTYGGHAQKLVRVEWEASVPAETGTRIYAEGKGAGRLTSVSPRMINQKAAGLAWLSKPCFDRPDISLTLETPSGKAGLRQTGSLPGAV